MKFAFSLPLLIAIAGGCGRNDVSLALTSAAAKQENDYLSVDCLAALDNQTGSPLVVTSAFYSAFDSLHLVVASTDGTPLAEQVYALHQSPYSVPGRPFVLPTGLTTQAISIPIFGLTNAPARVTLQLTGVLSQSSYTGALFSAPVDVTVPQR